MPPTPQFAAERDANEDSSATWSEEESRNSPLAENLEQLPSIISRGLVYLLIMFVVVAIAYCSFSKIDITRSVPTSIVPEANVQLIQSNVDGILTTLQVSEGQEVLQGATLAIVDSHEVVTQLAALRTAQVALADSHRDQDDVLPLKRQQLQAKIEILKEKHRSLIGSEQLLAKRIKMESASLLLSRQLHQHELSRQQETLKRIDVEISNAKAAIELWAIELRTIETLIKKKAASELELLGVSRSKDAAVGELEKLNSVKREEQEQERIAQVRLQAAEIEHEKNVAEIEELISNTQVLKQSAQLEQLQLEQEISLLELETAKRHQLVDYQHKNALAQATLNLPGLDEQTLSEIADGKGEMTNKTVIAAPMDGTIGKLFVINQGEAVTRGRTLMTLVPKGARLLGEMHIPDKDIALIKTDMPTRLKFDAFPFAEYGVITGKLEKVVPIAVTAEGMPPAYHAYSSLDQEYFLVNGSRTRLLPGMVATTEIVTDRKSILSLLLQPLLKLGQPKSAKP